MRKHSFHLVSILEVLKNIYLSSSIIQFLKKIYSDWQNNHKFLLTNITVTQNYMMENKEH